MSTDRKLTVEGKAAKKFIAEMGSSYRYLIDF